MTCEVQRRPDDGPRLEGEELEALGGDCGIGHQWMAVLYSSQSDLLLVGGNKRDRGILTKEVPSGFGNRKSSLATPP